jgi:hypothetical protein
MVDPVESTARYKYAARSEKYLCAFYGLSFGENKPHLGSYRNGWQAGPM